MSERQFFSGARGAARSPGDVCYRCSLLASEHHRDMIDGRDRHVCPSTTFSEITKMTEPRGQIAGQPPDRLSIAGAVARDLVGNLGPTLDQKTEQSDEAVYFLNTDGVNKFNLSTRQIQFIGGRRLGKSNAIANRMRANSRDAPLRERQIERAEQRAAGPRPEDGELQKFIETENARRRLRDEAEQARARMSEEQIRILMTRAMEPMWRVERTMEPVQPATKKSEPTITIGAKRAYYED